MMSIQVVARISHGNWHDACKSGDLRKVTFLLSNKGWDINALNMDGESPLHIACEYGHLEIVKVFLKDKKCDLDIQNSYGNTPLHVACYTKSLDIIRLLLEKRCSTNILNKEGETAQNIPLNKDGDCLLHIACQWGDVDIVRYLITDERCNPNVQSSTSENTPLHVVAKYGHNDTIAQLLSYKECNPNAQNKDGDVPLHLAASWNRTAVVSKLLAHQQCDINAQNKKGSTPLHLACYKRLLDVVKLLLKMRCSTNIPNKKGETAQNIPLNEDGDSLLHIASQWGDVDIVEYLITDERCNVTIQNRYLNTPLHLACLRGNVDIVNWIVTSTHIDLDIKNTHQNTPLHIACYRKSMSIIKLLLEVYCSTNIPNKKGETAQNISLNEDGDCLLHIACQWGNMFIVKYLITDQECVLSIQNTHLNTPLHLACYSKNLSIIRHLLEMKCNTNIPNKKGETAQDIPLSEDGDSLLHIACQWGDVDIVKYLITDEGCNPNVQSSVSENTPLHIAAMYGQGDTIVELLSFMECNPNAQNKEGDTPLHIACWRRALHIINSLLEMRCSTNIPNKKCETAQHVPLNKDGDCLLHIACQWGDVDIVRYLITDERCNPNVQSYTSGNTPLHIAANYGQNDTIAELLSYKECNSNAQNREGDTPLHFAVRRSKSAAIFQLLAYLQCNPNVQNKEGDTPLHIACWRKLLDIIKVLLEGKCSTNIPNKKGEIAQNISLNEDGDCLLHVACQWGDVGIVRYLITDEGCNLNVQSSISENTPLHIAAKYGQDDLIVQLLSCEESDPNVQDRDGDTPLHIAVRENIISAISQLLTSKQCNPNSQNKVGDTPLHIAVWKNRTPVISRLLANEQCNPNVQDKEGDTPLHIAVKENIIPAISQLLTCNPNVLNKDHLTPLLIATKHNNHTAATALLQHKDCDATLCDPHGNTPLHLACIGGETNPEMVKVAKQLLISVDVDPMCVNNAGQTPIELTTNYQLIQAISHMVQCKTKQSVQTYINMFIVGNPETGKSTLVKAICKEATSILWKIVPKQVRKVKNVPLHTAGIIPTTFRSKTFGNTVIYDLAGQVEYYTSHAAVIRSTVISTPPAFIVVVNLCESEEKISQTLRYWWSFIDNHASRSSAPPQVILVGSHADRVKSTGGSVQQTLTQMTDILKQLPASFHFAGQVALDCRDPASRKLQHFCSLVNQSCTVLRVTADVDLRCHVLYAFLLERFQGKVSCRVSDVAASVKENRELLPQNSDSLIPLILTLSDKGLLLLVKGGESHRDWWIILQKQALLGEVNGVIFAPKNFSQHKDIFQSTGVVLFSKLMEEFPGHDHIMVTEFLIHLEFCFKIEDHQTLALLKDEVTNMEDTSPDVSEEYYFFPALVSVEYPLHVWEENDKMGCKCGWIYKCIRPDQFLTTQFLHVLILRLAFTFALKFDPDDCHADLLALHRRCSVWKHGIAWLNTAPIETVVEVGLQHQSIIVMMRCPKGEEAECVQLCSKVIQKVLQAKDEHCKAVKMSESFIHPGIVKYPFTDNTGDVKLYRYSLEEIARMIIQGKANVLDRRGRNPISVQDLLLFDPSNTDTSPELLRELFSENHSMDETVRSQVLGTLNSESEKCMCPLCIQCA